MSCESGWWDIVEEMLDLNPSIHTYATRECPHCGNFRHITGYLSELWEANYDSDEVRYYIFHEPIAFLMEQAYIKERNLFRQLKLWEREVWLLGRQKGQLHKTWNDGSGHWSDEFLGLFPKGAMGLPENLGRDNNG